VAGEALNLITGIDLEAARLTGERAKDFAAGPSESPDDDDVEFDSDENLPWPDPAAVAAWWSKSQGGFPAGTRLLLGRPLAAESLRQVLVGGSQRQRAAAALELVLAAPGQPLFAVGARAARQRGLLR